MKTFLYGFNLETECDHSSRLAQHSAGSLLRSEKAGRLPQ